MRVLFLTILSSICLLAGCTKPRDLVAEDQAYITQRLGGHVILEQLTPPSGPFNLVKRTSRYWKAHVPKTDKMYWVEAYMSLWSVAGGEEIIRYRFYQKTPLVDVYYEVTQ